MKLIKIYNNRVMCRSSPLTPIHEEYAFEGIRAGTFPFKNSKTVQNIRKYYTKF
jgi:formate-dependent nitrite reductase cytochrome c552 subunit